MTLSYYGISYYGIGVYTPLPGTTASFSIIKNVNESFSLTIPHFIEDGNSVAEPTQQFNIVKNVEERFSLIVPGFIETDTSIAKISSSIAITAVATINLIKTATFVLISPSITAIPEVQIIATYTYQTTTNDCYIGHQGSVFDIDGEKLYIGKSNYTGGYYKAWIPFEITDITQGTTIINARLYFESWDDESGTTVKVKIGCENRDDVTALVPTSYADLNSRTMTTHSTIETVEEFFDEDRYSFDVTDAVQEIINRPLWVATNQLAILINDYGSTINAHRKIASFDNTDGYDTPYLEITA
jgi:hypothetical protein